MATKQVWERYTYGWEPEDGPWFDIHDGRNWLTWGEMQDDEGAVSVEGLGYDAGENGLHLVHVEYRDGSVRAGARVSIPGDDEEYYILADTDEWVIVDGYPYHAE